MINYPKWSLADIWKGPRPWLCITLSLNKQVIKIHQLSWMRKLPLETQTVLYQAVKMGILIWGLMGMDLLSESASTTKCLLDLVLNLAKSRENIYIPLLTLEKCTFCLAVSLWQTLPILQQYSQYIKEHQCMRVPVSPSNEYRPSNNILEEIYFLPCWFSALRKKFSSTHPFVLGEKCKAACTTGIHWDSYPEHLT